MTVADPRGPGPASSSCRPRPARPPTPARRSRPPRRPHRPATRPDPSMSTVVDGCGFGELGVDRPRDDRFLLDQHRLARQPRRGRFDPHRPPIRRPAGLGFRAGRDRRSARPPGRRPAPTRRATARPASRTRDAARRRSPAAHRPDTTSTPSPTRPRSTSATVTPGTGCVRQLAARRRRSPRSAAPPSSRPLRPRVRHRVARSATPMPGLLVPGVLGRLPLQRGVLEPGRRLAPPDPMNSSTLSVNASSISTLRFENTRSSSRGTPAISACPFTISLPADPEPVR